METEFRHVIYKGEEVKTYLISKTGIVKNTKGVVLKQSRPGYVMLSINNTRHHVKVVELIVSTFGTLKNIEEKSGEQQNELHYYSTNKSYQQMINKLHSLGIKNCSVHCRINNPKVIGLNPFSKDLTEEEKEIIIGECSNNIFYFIGECVRIPYAGSFERFELNLSTLASIWALDNGISSYTVTPILFNRDDYQNALAIWFTLFKDVSINYLRKINPNITHTEILNTIQCLPEYIKDTEKIKNSIIRITNTVPVNSECDVFLIGDFEHIKSANEILDANKDSILIINTTVGDPDEAGFDASIYIDKMSKWDVKFLDMDKSYIHEKLLGKLLHIQFPLEELVDDHEKMCDKIIRRYNYDRALLDRILFMRRKSYTDVLIENIAKDALRFKDIINMINTHEPDGYISELINTTLPKVKSRDVKVSVDFIQIATLYNVIKDVDLGENFKINLSENYQSFEEFALKTFGIIDENRINELIGTHLHINNKINHAIHSITGDRYLTLYPNIKSVYHILTSAQEAFKEFNN